MKRINFGLTDKPRTPAPFVECRQFADMITHCKVCRLPRQNETGGLNDSGYCLPCWQHIYEPHRTAPGRGKEQRRMHWALIRAARGLDRSLCYLRLVWIKERNNWLWRKRGTVNPDGTIKE